MSIRGPLEPSPDSIALANRAMWKTFVDSIPGAWMTEGDGADAIVTGLPLSSQNGVWATRPDVPASVVAGLLDHVAATGLPHLLALRGDTAPDVIDVARGRGMTLSGEEPAMILRDTATIVTAARVPHLSIREIGPGEGALHAAVAGSVFDVAPETFEQLMNPRALAVPGIRCYVGEAGGETGVTGVGVTLLGTTAVFSVATLPEQRRRGFGTAVTARAVADGLASGATWAWLHSSETGYRVYERLGFRTVETASFWSAG